jgi:hypothetical protein
MPQNAIDRADAVDHIVAVEGIAALVIALATALTPPSSEMPSR